MKKAIIALLILVAIPVVAIEHYLVLDVKKTTWDALPQKSKDGILSWFKSFDAAIPFDEKNASVWIDTKAAKEQHIVVSFHTQWMVNQRTKSNLTAQAVFKLTNSLAMKDLKLILTEDSYNTLEKKLTPTNTTAVSVVPEEK